MRACQEIAKQFHLPSGLHPPSAPPGRAGIAVVVGFVAFAFIASVTAPDASAATVVQTWQARIGASNALNDTATIQAYDTVKGVLRIRATKLRVSSAYTVTIYRGRCGFMGTVLFTLPSVTSNSSGNATKNLALSVTQVKKVRSTWNAGSGVAIQLAKGSSKRCGDLGAYTSVGKAARLEDEQTHTVVSAEVWGGGGTWKPKAGSSYVTVYVRITARTDTNHNPLDYSLIDGTGKEWRGLVFGDREPDLGSGDLSKGETVEAWVTLLAPTDQLNRLILAYRMNSMIHGPTLYVPLGTLVSATPGPSPSPGVSPSPSPGPSGSPTSSPGTVSFGDGTNRVGSDIQPGTYRIRQPADSCYWARLSGFGGTLDEIVANYIGAGYAMVTISPTDVGFRSERCGTWSSDLSRVTASTTSFGEGTLIVSTDVQPGTYMSSGTDSCYWARLSGFGGTLDDIIANHFGGGPAVVTILASDRGFKSSGCGTWAT
jgi:hypothetical protein